MNSQRLREIGTEGGALTAVKNEAYGSSFVTSAEALKLLYPDGIRPEQYTDVLLLARIWDKMQRIATDKDALGENPYRDLMGYAILGVAKDERGEGGKMTAAGDWRSHTALMDEDER